jgi:hypothetical protein
VILPQPVAVTEPSIVQMSQIEKPALTPEQEIALQKIDAFMTSVAPTLGRIFGMRDLQLERGNGWATDLLSGKVTYDPSFFVAELGYDDEMTEYATMHEMAAHLREVLTEPKLTQEVIRFSKPDEKTREAKQFAQAKGIFHEILADIAGNNIIHAALPREKDVAARLHRQKQFPDDPTDVTDSADDRPRYRDLPRHLQFLYKIIREEMIPDSETIVSPEVDAMITQFRDYNGMGDLIKYSTQVAKSAREPMPPREKFDIWTKVIFPEWQKLYEMDAEDPKFQEQEPQNSEGQPEQSQSGESDSKPHSENQPQQSPEQQNQDSSENGQPSDQNQDGQPQSGQPDFSDYYEEYNQRHPEPISHDEHEQIEQDARRYHGKQRADERAKQRKQARQQDPDRRLDEQIRKETGHGLAEKRAYDREIAKYADEINELRGIYRELLNEHIGQRRKLRGNHESGVILTPEHLARTAVQIRQGKTDIPAFSDYEKRPSNHELTGKTDFVFAFDCSGSMDGERSRIAASTAVICLEALKAIQDDIEEMGQAANIDLDVDIRTAIYAFTENYTNPKPLSTGLDMKERLDAFSEISSPGGGTSGDFLGAIDSLPVDSDRHQVLIVVSDGEFDENGRIATLRNKGWKVFDLSIQADEAVRMFAPDGRLITDPAELPHAMTELIKENF